MPAFPTAAAVDSAVYVAAAPAVVSAVSAVSAAAVGGAGAVTGAVDRHYGPGKISLPVIKISKKKKREYKKNAPRTRDICVLSPPFPSQDPAVTVAPACW